jgi:hypothetical protein
MTGDQDRRAFFGRGSGLLAASPRAACSKNGAGTLGLLHLGAAA